MTQPKQDCQGEGELSYAFRKTRVLSLTRTSPHYYPRLSHRTATLQHVYLSHLTAPIMTSPNASPFSADASGYLYNHVAYSNLDGTGP